MLTLPMGKKQSLAVKEQPSLKLLWYEQILSLWNHMTQKSCNFKLGRAKLRLRCISSLHIINIGRPLPIETAMTNADDEIPTW